MKFLATLKAERYEQSHHAYAVLAEFDWASKRLLRAIKLPGASFRNGEAFSAPLSGGLCVIGSRVFMALWNCVVELDYPSFTVRNATSARWMADLHGMTTDGRRLWVASTAVETVLCLDPATLEVLWRWGPDEPLLAQFPPARPFWRRLREPPYHLLDKGDFRHVHKSRSLFYRHHLNDVRWHDNALWITTKGWFGQMGSSSIIRLEPETRASRFLVPPSGGLNGVHDGVFRDDTLYVTECDGNSMASITPEGVVRHHPLAPKGFFVRGLCCVDDQFLVGFTRLRKQGGDSWIVGYDTSLQRESGRLILADFYPDSVGTAIHALLPSPVL